MSSKCVEFHRLTPLFFALLLSISCTRAVNKPDQKQAGEVNLAIWGNYLSKELQDKFTAQTGIQIHISNYSSNEELLAKVQTGSSGIDVAVPSDYMVRVMTKLDLLTPLEASKIPNKKNLDRQVLGQVFDADNKYSLPYAWSTTGLAVNTELVKGEIKSWKQVFENPDLAGKISMLEDAREVTAIALKFLGYSINTTKKEELDKAKALLLKFKPKIKMFRSDTIDIMLNKEVAIAHAYSTEALQAVQKSGGKIIYILPSEGGTRAIDNLVILKNAKHVDAAHALINFMLSSEVNVSFVKSILAGPVLASTKEFLPKDLQSNSALFPTQEQLSRFDSIHDLGADTKLYDELWTEVKSK